MNKQRGKTGTWQKKYPEEKQRAILTAISTPRLPQGVSSLASTPAYTHVSEKDQPNLIAFASNDGAEEENREKAKDTKMLSAWDWKPSSMDPIKIYLESNLIINVSVVSINP